MENISEKFNISSKSKQDGFLRMKQLKEDSGKKVVGIFCSYTPIELMPGYEISKVFESTHFMFNEEEKIATLKNITKSVYEDRSV